MKHEKAGNSRAGAWAAGGAVSAWLVLCGWLSGPGTFALAPGGVTELGFLNGTYSQLAPQLQPIEHSGLKIRLTSPQQELQVWRNQLSFQPAGGDVFAVDLEVELTGFGELIADLEGAGMSTRFSDRVEAPRQTVKLAGKAKVARTDEGFLVTVLEAPSHLRLVVKSQAIGKILDLCRGLDSIPLLSFDCPGLEQALSRVRVPLPPPGGQVLLPKERLTPAEQAFFARLANSP